MDFDDEQIIDKPCQDMTILDPLERKTDLAVPDVKQDMIDDYHYARDTYIRMIEQGQEALTGILEMCQGSPAARNFEVAGQYQKIIADNTDKLMKLSKEFKELNTEVKTGTEQTADVINNTSVVFNGTAEDLFDMMEEAEQQGKVIDIEE